MRKIMLIGAAAAVLLGGAPAAAAQIAPVIMIIPKTGPDKSCYNLNQPPNPKWIAEDSDRADRAFAEYLAIVKAKASLKKLFPLKESWALDDTRMNAIDAVDPWADKIQRTERTGLVVSNVGKWWFRGVWNVYDGEGRLLGRYDASFQGGRGSAFFNSLHLYSPNSTSKTRPITPFCNFPGDIQARQEDQDRRDAEKTARRASKR